MGEFQERVQRERRIVRGRLERHYAVVPPQDRDAKLDNATVDALLDRFDRMVVEEFSATYNHRSGALP